MKKKPLVILTGPTAVGKTALSLLLAKEIGGEIISADSMQVYRNMDIGSAKIKPHEMGDINHHMIDILEPNEEFNVVMFQRLVKQCMEEIYNRGKIPIITGGTGFYIQAIVYDIDFEKMDEDTSYRQELADLGEKNGNGFLHTMLMEVDPKSAQLIHENNTKRVIRALEFNRQTGLQISQHNEMEHKKESPYNFSYFVLNDNRKDIYDRIDQRVDNMIHDGLILEVKALKQKGISKDMVSMQGLGYKEILRYLDGEIDLENAIHLIKRDTRHFAKRQLTWFRREKDVIWVQKDLLQYDEDKIIAFMKQELKKMVIKENKT